MQIIQVNSPHQDERTPNIQLIDGKFHKWTTRVERNREIDGGYLGWIRKKSEFVKENNLKGIYLYDVTALHQSVVNGDDLLPPEIIYYIRFDYIKD